jgi:hypothetical protein
MFGSRIFQNDAKVSAACRRLMEADITLHQRAQVYNPQSSAHGELRPIAKTSGLAGSEIVASLGAVKDFLVLVAHLLATFVKLMRSDGARSVMAESLLLKHQLLALNRGRKRAPALSP